MEADTYIAFTHRAKAEAFERYPKSGSGHAFANKRLWSSYSEHPASRGGASQDC